MLVYDLVVHRSISVISFLDMITNVMCLEIHPAKTIVSKCIAIRKYKNGTMIVMKFNSCHSIANLVTDNCLKQDITHGRHCNILQLAWLATCIK